MSREEKAAEINRKFQAFAKRHPEWAGDYIEHVGNTHGFEYCEHCERIVASLNPKSYDCAECEKDFNETQERFANFIEWRKHRKEQVHG